MRFCRKDRHLLARLCGSDPPIPSTCAFVEILYLFDRGTAIHRGRIKPNTQCYRLLSPLPRKVQLREKQARLEARARIDIREFYERGEFTLKDHAHAVQYLKGFWCDYLPDAEIVDFICKEIRKLEPTPGINPAEQSFQGSASTPPASAEIDRYPFLLHLGQIQCE